MAGKEVAAWLWSTLWQAGWAPAAVFVLHRVASGLRAYDHYPDLDVPMHLAGGVAIAYFFHTASVNGSRRRVLGPYHRLTHVILVFALVGTAAVCWEFAEFLSDRYLGTNAQGGSLDDTLKDMALGMVGGAGFLVLSAIAHYVRGRHLP